MFSSLASVPPLRPRNRVEARSAEIEAIRARAIWNARRRFWFDMEGSPVLIGGKSASLLEQIRRVRQS